MEPYFSVILPIYNVEEYLPRCIKSVLNQSFSDYEIILVDDGSTDSCPIICDSYAAQYPFVETIHKKNGGLSSARNMGIEKARGRYILFFDSDDWIEESALTLIYRLLSKDETDIVKFNYFRQIEQNVPMFSIAEAGIYKTAEELETLRNMAFYSSGKYCMSACLHGYNKKFLISNDLKFVSEREVGSEDYLFNLEALMRAKSVGVIQECLYHYDLREGSLTQRYRNTLPEQYTKLYKKLREFLFENNLLNEYQNRLDYFYVWNLIYNCCIINEYTIAKSHNISEGRKRVREFLSFSEVKSAIKTSEKRNLTLKKKVELSAMLLRIEPLFYYLFVVKPKRKEKGHE